MYTYGHPEHRDDIGGSLSETNLTTHNNLYNNVFYNIVILLCDVRGVFERRSSFSFMQIVPLPHSPNPDQFA